MRACGVEGGGMALAAAASRVAARGRAGGGLVRRALSCGRCVCLRPRANTAPLRAWRDMHAHARARTLSAAQRAACGGAACARVLESSA
jgi:hypothetical protein